MAFNLENMSIDYKKMLRMIPSDRTTLAQSGVVNDLISSLTPGQLANLFPSYYRDQLPDIGMPGSGGASLTGALSGGTTGRYGGRYGGSGDRYSPVTRAPPPSKSAQELAVERILQENGIAQKTSVTPGPQETGFFGAIMRAEGTDAATAAKQGFENPYDTVLGYGVYGMPDKPLTEMTIAEVYNFQRNTLLKNHGTSSAAGAFQIVSRNIVGENGELTDLMKRAGLTLNDRFDAAAQRKLAYEIYKEQGLGAWEGFKNHPEEAQKAIAEVDNIKLEPTAAQIEELEKLKAELVPLADEIRKKLDTKTLELYDKGGPEVKWNIEHAISSVGVDEFNKRVETIAKTEKNVTATAEEISSSAIPNAALDPEAVGSKRRIPLTEYESGQKILNRMNWVAEQVSAETGEKIGYKIVSALQPPGRNDAERGGQGTGGYRHGTDVGAADIELIATDADGKTRIINAYSEGRDREILQATLKSIGKAGFTGIGLGKGYQEGNLHVGFGSDQLWNSGASGDAMRPEYADFIRQGQKEAADQNFDFDSYYAERLKKIQQQNAAASDPVAAAQRNIPQPLPPNANDVNVNPITNSTTSQPIVAPVLASGGTVPMTPGENIAGINTNTGKVEFMSNDRELYTKDDQGNLRVDPSTIKQEQPVQQAPADTQRLETPNQPIQRNVQQPVPRDNPDPEFLETMTSGSMASSPSQLRALNRAKLYNEDSSNLVNGHFA